MSGGIFALSGENLMEMREQAYDSEQVRAAGTAREVPRPAGRRSACGLAAPLAAGEAGGARTRPGGRRQELLRADGNPEGA